MEQLKNQRKSIFLKSVAIFVLISFALFNTSYSGLYGATPQGSIHPHHGISQADPHVLMGSLKLPEELGHIQEVYIPMDFPSPLVGEGQDGGKVLSSPPPSSSPVKGGGSKIDRLVIYLQSAHTNFDSEFNTQRIIEHLEKEYALPLVLLEGGEGRLDSLYFKSFPDPELKKKVLLDYLKRGDLSGGETASILVDLEDTKYYGIENQILYNQNKDAFLKAIQNEVQINQALDQIESKLNAKIKSLSPASQIFLEKKGLFAKEEIDLIDYLKDLKDLYQETVRRQVSVIASPSARNDESLHISQGHFIPFNKVYPELGKILTAQAHEKRLKPKEVHLATNGLIKSFQQKILPKLPKAKQMELNQMIQMERIGMVGEGMLVKRIENLAKEMNFTFHTPEALKKEAHHAETLSSIRGTKLFEELGQLEDYLQETLPQDENEKRLLEDFYHLGILRNFAKLEIVHKDWQRLEKCVKRNAECEVTLFHFTPYALHDLFADHFRFYELATKRDEALFENMLKAMEKEKVKVALISTGGFHSEGITKKLKQSNIPYILIAPKINELGDKETYLSIMKGNRSFMKYFKGSLWDALAQDYAAKLSASLKENELTPSLKRWRDRIIQNSIAENRITQATSYTKYVDALVQALRKEYEKTSPFQTSDFGSQTSEVRSLMSEDEIKAALQQELNSFFDNYFTKLESLIKQRLDIFTQGLKGLWTQKEVTPQAVGKLLDKVNTVRSSGLAPETVLIPAESRVTPAQPVDIKEVTSQLAQKYGDNPELIAQARAELRVTGFNPVLADLARSGVNQPEMAAKILEALVQEAARSQKTGRIIPVEEIVVAKPVSVPVKVQQSLKPEPRKIEISGSVTSPQDVPVKVVNRAEARNVLLSGYGNLAIAEIKRVPRFRELATISEDILPARRPAEKQNYDTYRKNLLRLLEDAAGFIFGRSRVTILERMDLRSQARTLERIEGNQGLEVDAILHGFMHRAKFQFIETKTGLFEHSGHFRASLVQDDLATGFVRIQIPVREKDGMDLFNPEERTVIIAYDLAYSYAKGQGWTEEEADAFAWAMSGAYAALYLSNPNVVRTKFQRLIEEIGKTGAPQVYVVQKQVGNSVIQLINGDITVQTADAIVNPSNPRLLFGIGVGGFILRRGGEIIATEASRKVPIQPGEAVSTSAGRLNAEYVIHTAVSNMNLEPDLGVIEKATKNVLREADRLKIESIAIPSFGTGVIGIPYPDSARVMLEVIEEHLKEGQTSLKKVNVVLYGDEAYGAYLKVLSGAARAEARTLGIEINDVVGVSESGRRTEQLQGVKQWSPLLQELFRTFYTSLLFPFLGQNTTPITKKMINNIYEAIRNFKLNVVKNWLANAAPRVRLKLQNITARSEARKKEEREALPEPAHLFLNQVEQSRIGSALTMTQAALEAVNPGGMMAGTLGLAVQTVGAGDEEALRIAQSYVESMLDFFTDPRFLGGQVSLSNLKNTSEILNKALQPSTRSEVRSASVKLSTLAERQEVTLPKPWELPQLAETKEAEGNIPNVLGTKLNWTEKIPFYRFFSTPASSKAFLITSLGFFISLVSGLIGGGVVWDEIQHGFYGTAAYTVLLMTMIFSAALSVAELLVMSGLMLFQRKGRGIPVTIPATDEDLPTVSILIPVRNESVETIERTLDSVMALD
ncbi:MAG: macro domain-containing protein, partial [Candidatus Omnitrophica bacterium]|nr:macro domain-containing protein [Candidatus Omnitrophota bacterium]